MSAPIKVFYVHEKCFKHVMNTRDDSVELHDENGTTLLIYDAEARVSDPDGQMGFLHCEYLDGQAHWIYYDRARPIGSVFGPDLPSAEVEVSKHYLGNA